MDAADSNIFDKTVKSTLKSLIDTVSDSLFKYGMTSYSKEINDLCLAEKIDKKERQLFFKISLSDSADIDDALKMYYDAIFKIAGYIVDNIEWDSEYRQILEEHLYPSRYDKAITGETVKDSGDLDPAAFYSSLDVNLESRFENVKRKMLMYVASDLNDPKVCTNSRSKARRLIKQLFNNADIIIKAEYMVHNRWYDKEWFKATALQKSPVLKLLTGEKRDFQFLEEHHTGIRECYYTASKEVYKMLFHPEKIKSLNKTDYAIYKDYIKKFTPDETKYTFMLSEAIPPISNYTIKLEEIDEIEEIDEFHKKTKNLTKITMPTLNKKTPEEINKIIFKSFMYPISDVGYLPQKLTITTFKNWLNWIEISDINTIKQLSNPEIWPLIDDNVFLIPKNLTLKQITEFYRGNKELILYEINKSDITANGNKYYVKDYLFDLIAYDEHFISRQNGNPVHSNTANQKRPRLTVNKAVKDYTSDIVEKCDDKICKNKCKVKEHEDDKDKPGRDIRSKSNRTIDKCENYRDVILPIMKKQWLNFKGIGVSEKDIAISKNRIKMCIVLIAFFLSENGRKFIEFMKENPQLYIEK